MTGATPHTLGSLPAQTTQLLRPAHQVLDPADMGGARATRHSFARSVVRHVVAQGWAVTREQFDVDDVGRGMAVYRIDAAPHRWHLVVFSQVLAESERQDRVIAGSWDVTLALVEGELDEQRIAELQANVPRQEGGRADQGTIIWARGNRSARFFDAVVKSLVAGEQPDPTMFGASPYVMRSTAFYSNGKFGLADFERFDADHPFAVPYRPHFLAAWLMREFSCDLVEHCARALRPTRSHWTRGGAATSAWATPPVWGWCPTCSTTPRSWTPGRTCESCRWPPCAAARCAPTTRRWPECRSCSLARWPTCSTAETWTSVRTRRARRSRRRSRRSRRCWRSMPSPAPSAALTSCGPGTSCTRRPRR